MKLTLAVKQYLCSLALVVLQGVLASGCAAQSAKPQVEGDVIGFTIQQRVESAIAADTKPALVVGGMSIARGVSEFYSRRGFSPAWNNGKRIDQLLAALAELRFDGLDPSDYRLDTLQQQRQQLGEMSGPALADFDILATHSYLLALVHLYKGKVDPLSLDSHWNFDAHVLDPEKGMQVAIDAVSNADINAAFNRARPQHMVYTRLREAMKQLYVIEAAGGWPQIPAGPTLKPGMSDARVALLRQRLRAADLLQDAESQVAASDADSSENLYDTALSTIVTQFQREQYLETDGNVGVATLAALNIPLPARMDQLRANLERGRWLLHELHDDFVLVDIAGYKVTYYKNGVASWSSRVQVGKPYRSTPIFKSEITYITLNPTWTVPPTILRKDILPKIRANPGYLAKQNIRVLDPNGKQLDPSKINWNNPGNIILRQDAGDDGALGKIVIRFPNPYSVYLHDTPHKIEFGRGQRAFSSGCIRVEHPLDLAERLFDPGSGWDRAAIEAGIATGKTRNVTLPRKIPLLLAYWTVDLPASTPAQATDNQRVAFKPDVYKRDPALIQALHADRGKS